MSLGRVWSSLKMLYFSKPSGERPLFRAVRDRLRQGNKIETVLEVNIGNGQRSERLIQWVAELTGGTTGTLVRYAAIDPFEMGGPGNCSLKEFHSRIGKMGVKPFPVPDTGNLQASLTRVAHTLGAVDLIVLDGVPKATLEEPAVQSVLGRLCHDTTLLLCKAGDAEPFVAVKLTPGKDSERMAA